MDGDLPKSSTVRFDKRFIVLILNWALILHVVSATGSTQIAAAETNFEDCIGCHEESLAWDSSRTYLHAPYEMNQCAQCHAEEAPEVKMTNEQNDGRDYQHKIDWLANSSLFAASHGFLISEDRLGNVLVVELKKEDGVTLRHEFTIPRLADVNEIKDVGKKPDISDLQLLEVHQGIRLSAKIGWNTDTLTDATVHYGGKELSESSESQKRFGRQHQVELHNLKADTTYRFVAVSSDLFGRSQVSEPATFSTGDSLAASQQNYAMYNILPAEKQTAIACRFSRSGSKYFIELDLAQPSSIYVGSIALPRGQRMPADDFHAGLRNLEGSSLRSCLNCHTRHDHPLNVSPQKAGISIPTEFPTLPGGRITCTSCHMPHGADFYFLTRRPPEKELCSNCHKDRGQ